MTLKRDLTAFEPTWESLARFAVPQWYQDAKFGIFIHWGLYSVPAFDNEWYSRNMYVQGTPAFEHHQKTWGDQSQFGYKDFIPHFTAERFDPDNWIDLFQRAGARYIVPVAEHHDGFMMYDSALSRWTAKKMGPKRDLIGELAAAARRKGLVFGASNHRAEHWWFMNGGRAYDSDVQDPAYADFYGPAMPSPMSYLEAEWNSKDWQPRPDAKFLEDWLARNCEFVDRYQPQLVYFDWWIEQIVFAPYLQRFAAYYYNRGLEWNLDVAINCKNAAFPDGTVVFDVERGVLKDTRSLFWQTDTSISRNSWGYVTAQDYKPVSSLIHDLIDVVSKNGALLLNIGPKPDGTIPESEVNLLLEIGHWLAINGEAIHGSRPWKIYGEGPTEVFEGLFQDTKRTAFTARDVRFTTQGDTLYAIALGVPEDGEIIIDALGRQQAHYEDEIGQVRLLGTDVPLQWSRDDNMLRVRLPDAVPFESALTLKIEPRR